MLIKKEAFQKRFYDLRAGQTRGFLEEALLIKYLFTYFLKTIFVINQRNSKKKHFFLYRRLNPVRD